LHLLHLRDKSSAVDLDVVAGLYRRLVRNEGGATSKEVHAHELGRGVSGGIASGSYGRIGCAGRVAVIRVGLLHVLHLADELARTIEDQAQPSRRTIAQRTLLGDDQPTRKL